MVFSISRPLLQLRWAALAFCSVNCVALSGSRAQNAEAATEEATHRTGQPQEPSWIVRDPRTGRVYRQQLITTNVPTVT